MSFYSFFTILCYGTSYQHYHTGSTALPRQTNDDRKDEVSVGNGTMITGMTFIQFDVIVEETLHVANPNSRIGIGPEENNVQRSKISSIYRIPYKQSTTKYDDAVWFTSIEVWHWNSINIRLQHCPTYRNQFIL